jgi:hypothetical protein
MPKVDLDGGPSRSEKRDARVRVNVHQLMNVIESGSGFLVEMAGKGPSNVVFSAMAGQLARIKGVDGLEDRILIGGAAHARAKPVVIVNRCIGLETRT